MHSDTNRTRFQSWLHARCACLVLLIGLFASPLSHAQGLNYTITYQASTGRATVVSSQYGTWQAVPSGPWGVLHLISTAPGTQQPPNTTRHVVQFDVMSPNYFSTGGGHFGLFSRADMYTQTYDPSYPYRGHGVILGDVSAYPSFNHPYGYPCTPTPAQNRIAIEVAGASPVSSQPNCVFGQETYSPQVLANGAWYRVRLVSGYSNGQYQTSYSLYLPTWVGWLEYTQRTKTYAYPALPSNLGGWFFAETFKRSTDWTLYITNLDAHWE